MKIDLEGVKEFIELNRYGENVYDVFGLKEKRANKIADLLYDNIDENDNIGGLLLTALRLVNEHELKTMEAMFLIYLCGYVVGHNEARSRVVVDVGNELLHVLEKLGATIKIIGPDEDMLS